jgi:hypothetical protein
LLKENSAAPITRNTAEIPFPLRFLVLGAQKAATSWLYYCLRDHPQIVLPVSKIEHAYIGGRTFREKGEAWYFSRFENTRPDAVHGEVAVDYLLDPSAPVALPRYTEDPRFVVMIRHPVERLISAYYWSVRRSQLPNLPIETAIKPLLAEPAGFPNRFADRYFDELVRRAFYGEQLEPYLAAYDPSRFLVITHEEVKADPARVVKRVYAHIGVDSSFEPVSLRVTPKKNSYHPVVVAFERLSKRWSLGSVADRMNRVLANVKTADPGLSVAARTRLLELFQPHIVHTQAVLQKLPEANRPQTDLTRLWS